jgi:hypothetical protein
MAVGAARAARLCSRDPGSPRACTPPTTPRAARRMRPGPGGPGASAFWAREPAPDALSGAHKTWAFASLPEETAYVGAPVARAQRAYSADDGAGGGGGGGAARARGAATLAAPPPPRRPRSPPPEGVPVFVMLPLDTVRSRLRPRRRRPRARRRPACPARARVHAASDPAQTPRQPLLPRARSTPRACSATPACPGSRRRCSCWPTRACTASRSTSGWAAAPGWDSRGILLGAPAAAAACRHTPRRAPRAPNPPLTPSPRRLQTPLQWSAVERAPRAYNWAGYRQLLEALRPTGLRLQAVLSFHACGGNVGDHAQVPLPEWVLQVRRARAGTGGGSCLQQAGGTRLQTA